MKVIGISVPTEVNNTLLNIIERFMVEYDCYSGEKVAQDDDCQIHASELLGDIVDLLDEKGCIKVEDED